MEVVERKEEKEPRIQYIMVAKNGNGKKKEIAWKERQRENDGIRKNNKAIENGRR